jgi:hypothetical protein
VINVTKEARVRARGILVAQVSIREAIALDTRDPPMRCVMIAQAVFATIALKDMTEWRLNITSGEKVHVTSAEKVHTRNEERVHVTRGEKAHITKDEKVRVIIEMKSHEDIIEAKAAIKVMKVRGTVAMKCPHNINAVKECVILKGIDARFSQDLSLLKDPNKNLSVCLN